MSFTAAFIFTMVIGLLVIGSLIGYVVIDLSISKTSKKYRKFVRELKKQNRYAEWAKQHSGLVIAEKVFLYGSVLCLLALLVLFGIGKDFISAPRIIVIVSGVLVYLFWPFSFVSILVVCHA